MVSNSGIQIFNSRVKLVKKIGPGELMGNVESEINNGVVNFTGLQVDQPGIYIISVIPLDKEIEPTEFTITVEGDLLPASSEKPEEKPVEGTRPIIAQIDTPTIKLNPITFPSPDPSSDPSLIKEMASSFGSTPFLWFNGFQVPERGIRNLKLFYEGMDPMCSAIFEDVSGTMNRDSFPLDDTTFEIFFNSQSESLKSIHMRFKLIDFKKNKDNSYSISGRIDLKDYYKINFKSYSGNSFDVIRNISNELELGFNSNITKTDDDMKWTNVGKKYSTFLSNIIKHSYISDQSFVLGYIDFYYCFNYVDLEKEWNRDNSNDVCIDSGNLGRYSKNNDGERLNSMKLSNDKSLQGSVTYFSDYKVDNNSTAISTTRGQFTVSKFYDTATKSFLIFDVDSISSTDDTKVILKGKPTDGKEQRENFRTSFGGRFDFSNVHKNYIYAKTQNKRNLENLSRISCEITIPSLNFNLYKFQKINIQFVNHVQTASDPDLIQKRISGNWMIVDIRYEWNRTSVIQKIVCVRKELEKLPEEIENQVTTTEPEKKGENVNEEIDIKPPNSIYEVGEIYKLKNKSGDKEYTITIENLLDNGNEIQGYIMEIPKQTQPQVTQATPQTNENITKTETITDTPKGAPVIEPKLDGDEVKMSGWFEIPKSVNNKPDAFHSFNTRKSDSWGGRLTQGQILPEKLIDWKNYINVSPGGINGALKKYQKETGNFGEIRLLEFTLLDFEKWRCEWVVYIGKSTDGKHRSYVGTVGGIGIGGKLKPSDIEWNRHPGTSGKIGALNLRKGNWKPVPIKVNSVKGITGGKQYEKAQAGVIEIVNNNEELQLRQFFVQSDSEIY